MLGAASLCAPSRASPPTPPCRPTSADGSTKCLPRRRTARGPPMSDAGRTHDVSGLTTAELERTRRGDSPLIPRFLAGRSPWPRNVLRPPYTPNPLRTEHVTSVCRANYKTERIRTLRYSWMSAVKTQGRDEGRAERQRHVCGDAGRCQAAPSGEQTIEG